MSVIGTAITLSAYIPDVIRGIKEGAEILERLQAGDLTAEEQAKDWLGITAGVQEAVKEWDESKDSAGAQKV